MSRLGEVSRIYHCAMKIPFDDSSRIVFMSDVHRGDGSWADDFSKNQKLYMFALAHYYKERYTYIEIGDGDELWKFDRLSDIINVHSDVFWMLAQFYHDDRLQFIYGNHDIVKRNHKYVKQNMFGYYRQRDKEYIPLFENIKMNEGLLFVHHETGMEIFAVHGHQVDFMNSTLWPLTKFFVRYLHKPLALFGVVNDATSTARNYRKKERIERKLTQWVIKEKCMMITGHTHRPMFPEVGEPLYFNDGSCVHPRCITAIEIVEGQVILVKWTTKTKQDGTVYIARAVIAGPEKLKNYFDYDYINNNNQTSII